MKINVVDSSVMALTEKYIADSSARPVRLSGTGLVVGQVSQICTITQWLGKFLS